MSKGTGLAEASPVVDSTQVLERRLRARRRGDRGGFSLIELMVVIVIIGVMAALALPSMRLATFDRHAYDDAGAIVQLFRAARTRSVARGAAVLISMTSSQQTDRGTFLMYEAVTQNGTITNAGGSSQGAFGATPVGSCKTPTVWIPLPTAAAPNPNVLLIDGVNLNGPPEVDADIETTFRLYTSGTTPPAFSLGYVCYTPLGRSYVSASAAAAPAFNNQLPNTSPIEVLVQRLGAGGSATGRSVLVPPNGMPRIFSHVLP